MPKVMVSGLFNDEQKAAIQARLQGMEVVFARGLRPADYKDQFKGIDYFIGFHIDADLFNSTPSLKGVHFLSAGINHALEHLTQLSSPVALSASKGVSGPGIAEYTIGAMLAFNGGFFPLKNALSENREQVQESFSPRVELAKQSVLILGYGHIGQILAKKLDSLGATLWGFGRSEKSDTTPLDRYLTTDIDELLPLADHVVSLLPATKETDDFFSASRLQSLKSGSCFYSLGRSEYIDHDALLAALKSGLIKACLLDKLPTDQNHEILKHPNAFVSDGAADWTTGKPERQIDLLVENAKRVLGGKDPLGSVDLGLGY